MAHRARITDLAPAHWTERMLQDAILDAATKLGWRSYHTWNSMHSAGGFPDLVLVRSDRLLFVECKRQSGKVSDDQRAWIDSLKEAGEQAIVVRPSEYDAFLELLK